MGYHILWIFDQSLFAGNLGNDVVSKVPGYFSSFYKNCEKGIPDRGDFDCCINVLAGKNHAGVPFINSAVDIGRPGLILKRRVVQNDEE